MGHRSAAEQLIDDPRCHLLAYFEQDYALPIVLQQVDETIASLNSRSYPSCCCSVGGGIVGVFPLQLFTNWLLHSIYCSHR
ncbi:hypothetical protein PsorP6_012005 [Peronosclerospora sorghi]|uniref:Uncharacterized protein n=1 Tax=Peronosclerospora sorghi TaxID=230839 RepID=A0ACC0WJW5_9STRA|nr:hypothetical protein PsorP6_012005 [Peronosclerospora sorghi]